MPTIKQIREKLDELHEKFKNKKRKGLVLTLLAITRLIGRGEKATTKKIVEEAHKIMNEHPNIDWGVKQEEYTIGLASTILKELEEMGLLQSEETPQGIIYTLPKTGQGDPRAEILARFGYLIFYGGPAR